MTTGGTRIDPFGETPDCEAYVPRQATENALDRIEGLLEDRSRPIILQGPPGIGKTMLLRMLELRQRDRLTTLIVTHPTFGPDEICTWILGLMGEPAGDDADRTLVEKAHALEVAGSGLLVAIDEAASMPVDTTTRLLSVSERAGSALALVLSVVDDDRSEAVITAAGPTAARVLLERHMDVEETAAYVRVRMLRGGVPQELRQRFDARAAARIQESSQGMPRDVNEHAREWLIREEGGTVHGSALVDEHTRSGSERDRETVRDPDVRPDPETGRENHRPVAPQPVVVVDAGETDRAPRRRTPLWIAACLGVGALAGFFWVSARPDPPHNDALAVAIEEQRTPPPRNRFSERRVEVPVPAESTVPREPIAPAMPTIPPEPPSSPREEPELASSAELEVAALVEESDQVAQIHAPPVPPPDQEVDPGVVEAIDPGIGATTAEPAAAEMDQTDESADNEDASRAADEELVSSPEDQPGVDDASGTAVAPPAGLRVNVNARPWARISVDGRDVGFTPIGNLSVQRGPHVFRAELPDGRIVERRTDILTSGQRIVFR